MALTSKRRTASVVVVAGTALALALTGCSKSADGNSGSTSTGGAANTGEPNSGALVVNWLAPAQIPFLELQAGYMFNHKGESVAAEPGSPAQVAADETMRTFSARYMIPFASTTELGPTLAGRYLDLVPFVEYVDVTNENGIAGNDTPT